MLSRYQSNIMPMAYRESSEVLSATASLHPDYARRMRSEELVQLRAIELITLNRSTFCIKTDNVEPALSNIDTQSNRMHRYLLDGTMPNPQVIPSGPSH
jgi:hypothetical protein